MRHAQLKSVAQQSAEASVANFASDLGPFVVAAETTRMAMAFTDAKAVGDPIIFANEAFLFLTGYDSDEVLGKPLEFLAQSCSGRKTLTEIAAACHGNDGGPDIKYLRKDGTAFWASTFVSFVHDEDGQLVQHFVSLADNTQHHEERARCHALIDELNHRVKNTLSTIQGVVTQAISKEPNKAILRDAIESRMFALARLHDLLSHVSWKKVGLRDVIDAALQPTGLEDSRSTRITLDGLELFCSPKATIALGIALHELAINARQHGSLSADQGSLQISWRLSDEAVPKMLSVCWKEANGPTVAAPQLRGYGSRILERGLAHELGGSVTTKYHATGLECVIAVPAAAEFE